MRHYSIVAVGIVVSLVGLAGCGGTPTETTGAPSTAGGKEATATAANAESIVPASSSAVAAGIDHWATAGSGVASGYDTNGKLVVKFEADGQTGIVKSVVPDVGSKSLRDSNAPDTLSPRTAEYLRLFMADIKTQLNKVTNESQAQSIEDKYVYSCYSNYYDCDVTCTGGLYYGWWNWCSCDNGIVYACGARLWTLDYGY